MSQKKRKRREQRAYGATVQRAAVEQWKSGVSAAELARQLGVHRNTIQNWIRAVRESGTDPVPTAELVWQRRAEELQLQIEALQATVGRQAMEVRFFKGALRRIEASRQPNTKPGGTASTPKSEA